MIKFFEDFNNNSPFNIGEHMIFEINRLNSKDVVLFKIISEVSATTIGGDSINNAVRRLFSVLVENVINEQHMNIYFNMIIGKYSNYFGNIVYDLIWRGYNKNEAIEIYKKLNIERLYNI